MRNDSHEEPLVLHSHLMTDPAKVRQFILAGNAYFTLKSLKTGDHFTFRVKKSKKTPTYFVNVRSGPEDGRIYHLLGLINTEAQYNALKKNAYRIWATKSGVAFDWFWRHLTERNHIPTGLEVWHDGRCCRCGRRLTDPESIDRGIGPECYSKV